MVKYKIYYMLKYTSFYYNIIIIIIIQCFLNILFHFVNAKIYLYKCVAHF